MLGYIISAFAPLFIIYTGLLLLLVGIGMEWYETHVRVFLHGRSKIIPVLFAGAGVVLILVVVAVLGHII